MGLFDNSDSSAQNYLKQALAAYQNANVPTIAAETVGQLPMQTIQGVVTPQAINAVSQAPSAYNNISLDPATRAAQMAALGQYTNIASAGGLDPAAKLALQETINATNAQDRGAQEAIMRAAQAEGQGGGDFALTQRAIESQGASNTAATQGLETAAMAEANREAALNAMANIGGGINAADYAQAAQKAAAQNQINATNQAATNTANLQNVENQITSGEFNVGTAQGVNAANTAAGQGRAYYNASLPQRQFENELAKAGGIAGVSQEQATAAQNAQNAGLNFAGSLLGTAGTVGATAMGGPVAGLAARQAMPARQTGGTVVGTAPSLGQVSTPNNPNQYRPIGAAHGGYTCYAEGGVSHNHEICEKLGKMDMRGGGHVIARTEEEKAEAPGDDEANDKIPAELSEGELVIPRSVPKTGDAMEKFAKNAPVAGDTSKRVDMTGFTKGYRRSR